MKCANLESLDGVEHLVNLKEFIFFRKKQPLSVKQGIQVPSVAYLELDAVSDWSNDEDIKTLARVFPNVQTVRCNTCGPVSLGLLANFKKLQLIQLDLGGLRREAGIGPPPEFDFTGLPYEALHIELTTSIDTNISCRNLGIWSYKIRERYVPDQHNEHVKPYRAMVTCYPELSEIGEKLIQGDALYKQGDLESAHRRYLDAFHINPYDQRTISRLALTYYKKGEYCRSAQVARSGTVLVNGTNTTRSSIWFNYHLALKSLGRQADARAALQKSIEYNPSQRKRDMLAQIQGENAASVDCPFTENWIDQLYASLETAAIQRSRSGVVNDECYHSNPTFARCRRGKGGICFKTNYGAVECR